MGDQQGAERQVPIDVVEVKAFWDAYFANRLEAATRVTDSGYTFRLPAKPSGKELVPQGAPVEARLARGLIAEYSYADDPRFLLGVHASLAAAISAVANAPVMRNESIPNRHELEFVLELLGQPRIEADLDYNTLRESVLDRLSGRQLSALGVSRAVEARIPGAEEHGAYKSSGKVVELHAEREIVYKSYAVYKTDDAAQSQLEACVRNREFEDVQTAQVAVWSMGRHNHKRAIDFLIRVLRDEECPYLHGLAQHSLQRLCSGADMLGMVGSHDAAENWAAVAATLPRADAADAWARVDAESIFWEKRLRVAAEARVGGRWSELQRTLACDEVRPVRIAAGGPEELES